MKSRISFLNPTALKKDITRYAPVWGVYTIFLLLTIFGMSDTSPAGIADNIFDILGGMSWMNLIYGGICAAFLFMDLFNGRLCNALHAFPYKRENWLLTHILSGLLFSLVPSLLASLILSVVLWQYAYAAFLWLAVCTLQYLFFFGTGVLSALCAGNLLGTAAIYGIFHLVTYLLYGVLEILYMPLLHGVVLNTDVLFRFFPLLQFTRYNFVEFRLNYNELAGENVGVFQGFVSEAWLYLGLCALVGVISLFLAWRVYRKRNLEAAGDFISLRPLSPVFLLVCTMGCGAILYLFSELFENRNYLFLAIGMALGYFAGRMLLNRTVKVFTKKSLMGLAVLLVVFGGSLLLTWADPLGITRYVPDSDKVQDAVVFSTDAYYYYEGNSYEDYEGFAFTDAERITDIRKLHSKLVSAHVTDENRNTVSVRIRYTLKNGRTVYRHYDVAVEDEVVAEAAMLLSDLRYLFQVDNVQALHSAVESVKIYSYHGEKDREQKILDPQQIAGLLEALKADSEAGKLAQQWGFHKALDIQYSLDYEIGGFIYGDKHLRIWPDAVNTFQYLKSIGN